MWSSWPWVRTMASTWRPFTFFQTAEASWAGSMTTHCSAPPTIHTLLSTSNVSPSRENVPEVTR